jgi:hypothetical protein
MENTSLTEYLEYCNNEAYKYEALEKMIRTEVIPHVGGSSEEGRLLVARRMLLLTFAGSQTHRRSRLLHLQTYQRSRCFLANLTRQYYGKLVKEVRRPPELLRGSWRQDGRPLNCIKSTNIEKIIKSSTIESGLKSALCDREWGLERSDEGCAC